MLQYPLIGMSTYILPGIIGQSSVWHGVPEEELEELDDELEEEEDELEIVELQQY